MAKKELQELSPQRPWAKALWIGPIALYIAATAFGILEVHSSTDTWIGLAGGRSIWEKTDWLHLRDTFPVNDTFSYTFNGKRWFNQNWLTHVAQYVLHEYVSPDAVIYGTWLLAASIFAFVVIAAYDRSGSALGAVLAGAYVGIGCRDFLSARPATTGFFCMAALWALFCAIEGQRDKRRWWPIVLLLPLLVVWGHAHGSFIFAYAVLAMYIGHWIVIRISQIQTRSWTLRIVALVVPLLLFTYLAQGNAGLLFLDAIYAPDNWKWFQHPMRWILIPIYVVFWIIMVTLKPRLSASGRQITALSVVFVVALLITVITSPFGLDNLTHSEKVSESNLFRQVSEWRRPWLPRAFPPMLRFWWMLGLTAATVLGAWMLGLVCKLTTPPDRRPPETRPLHTTLFDVATVMIGVGMTLWARRFAPMLYIFSAPILLTWIMLFLRPVPLRLKARLRTGLMIAALIGAVLPPLSWLPGARHLPTGLARVLDNTEGLAWRTGRRAHKQLVTLFEKNHPDYGLLERVTRYDLMPSQAFIYLRDNKLQANVFAEWTQAGRIMFFAPNAKVFIDGRSQQVYDEAHYRKYLRVMSPGNRPGDVFKIFNESRTDMVIMRPSTATLGLYRALRSTPNWVLVLQGTNVEPYLMFVRRGSALHKRLGQLARSGLEKRPDTPEALGTLGLLLASTAPRDAQERARDYERALRCWLGAVRAQPSLGVVWYANITRMYLDSRRVEQARQFVQGQQQILRNRRADLSDTDRKSLTNELGRCTQMIAAYVKRAADRQNQTP